MSTNIILYILRFSISIKLFKQYYIPVTFGYPYTHISSHCGRWCVFFVLMTGFEFNDFRYIALYYYNTFKAIL